MKRDIELHFKKTMLNSLNTGQITKKEYKKDIKFINKLKKVKTIL